MGSAVKVHPLAVVLVVAGGAMIAGIPGALFAVPLAAFVNVAPSTIGASPARGAQRRSTADSSGAPFRARRRKRDRRDPTLAEIPGGVRGCRCRPARRHRATPFDCLEHSPRCWARPCT
jgi:hypothetical protein